MDLANMTTWNDLAFKTTIYQKNFDLVSAHDNNIIESEGVISKLRIKTREAPIIIGEFSLSMWDIVLSEVTNMDIRGKIKEYSNNESYVELGDLIDYDEFNCHDYKKILIIHSVILLPEFRNKEVVNEFVESIYRTYAEPTTAILAFVTPIQKNEHFLDYYTSKKMTAGDKIVRASDYYDIDGFLDKTDEEKNLYKLYTVAVNCGFNRLGISNLFMLDQMKPLERIKDKEIILNKARYENNN
jgi:hypothetical protein